MLKLSKILLLLSIFILAGCHNYKHNYNIDKLAQADDYAVMNYSVAIEKNLTNISAMQIFYPVRKNLLKRQEQNSQVLAKMAISNAPSVVVFHGYRSRRQKMYWLGGLLASKGYVVAIPTIAYYRNPLNRPTKWIGGFDHAIKIFKLENKKASSPIYNKVDFNNLNLIGHSMGGGGLMHFVQNNADKKLKEKVNINSVVAMAPFQVGIKPGSKAQMPVLIICGLQDYVAPCRMSKDFYKILPEKIEKAFIKMKNVRHPDFERWVKYNNEIGNIVLQWLDIMAKGDKKLKDKFPKYLMQ